MKKMTRHQLENHDCAKDTTDWWPLRDAQSIYLCRVCSRCEDAKRAVYRPEILSGYDQNDVNEEIG